VDYDENKCSDSADDQDLLLSQEVIATQLDDNSANDIHVLMASGGNNGNDVEVVEESNISFIRTGNKRLQRFNSNAGLSNIVDGVALRCESFMIADDEVTVKTEPDTESNSEMDENVILPASFQLELTPPKAPQQRRRNIVIDSDSDEDENQIAPSTELPLLNAEAVEKLTESVMDHIKNSLLMTLNLLTDEGLCKVNKYFLDVADMSCDESGKQRVDLDAIKQSLSEGLYVTEDAATFDVVAFVDDIRNALKVPSPNSSFTANSAEYAAILLGLIFENALVACLLSAVIDEEGFSVAIMPESDVFSADICITMPKSNCINIAANKNLIDLCGSLDSEYCSALKSFTDQLSLGFAATGMAAVDVEQLLTSINALLSAVEGFPSNDQVNADYEAEEESADNHDSDGTQVVRFLFTTSSILKRDNSDLQCLEQLSSAMDRFSAADVMSAASLRMGPRSSYSVSGDDVANSDNDVIDSLHSQRVADEGHWLRCGAHRLHVDQNASWKGVNNLLQLKSLSSLFEPQNASNYEEKVLILILSRLS